MYLYACKVLLLLLLLLLCVAILLLLLQLLMFAAAVCHRVRMAKNVAGSLNLIPVYFKHDLFSMYPVAVLSHLRPRFAYILGSYGHAWAREAKAAPL